MTLEAAVRAAMLANAGVAALIGTRLYDTQLPQAPATLFPCVTYQRISTRPQYSHTLATSATFGWARFQFRCVGAGANGGEDSRAVADALIAAAATFNASAVPASPQTLTQAPNYLLNRFGGIVPQTPQPLFETVMDLKIYFGQENT